MHALKVAILLSEEGDRLYKGGCEAILPFSNQEFLQILVGTTSREKSTQDIYAYMERLY
jgi:hypothetical protein